MKCKSPVVSVKSVRPEGTQHNRKASYCPLGSYSSTWSPPNNSVHESRLSHLSTVTSCLLSLLLKIGTMSMTAREPQSFPVPQCAKIVRIYKRKKQ